MSTDPRIAVAQHLTAIVELSERLEDQAINDANDHLMPGGLAMVALASVANLEAWAHKVDAAERHGLRLAIEDDDEWVPPLQTLLFWSEDLRRTHDLENESRPTIASEANVIRWALDWLWENEPHFEDFARDMRDARRQTETLLMAGERADRIRVTCPDCEAGKRLIIMYGATEDDDQWKCPACKHRFTADDVDRAYRKQLRHQGAERWVRMADAVSIMRGYGWRGESVRGWVDGTDVEAATDDTGTLFAWWPDLWRAHLVNRQRCEEARRVARERALRKAFCEEFHEPGCWEEGHQGKPGQRGCAGIVREMTAM